MTELSARRCVPCEGGIAPLSRAAAEEVLQRLDGDWQLAHDATRSSGNSASGFPADDELRHAVAHVANIEDHHPDSKSATTLSRALHHARHQGTVRERLHLRRKDRPAAARVRACAARAESCHQSQAGACGQRREWSGAVEQPVEPCTTPSTRALPARRSRW